MGAFQYFRNPSAHKFSGVTREEAFDILTFANRLISIIDIADGRRRAKISSTTTIPQFRYGWDYGPLVLDVNNDGVPETISKSPNEDHVVEILHTTDGVLRPQDVEQPGGTFWFFSDAATVDIDGDGLQELVCFCEGATQGSALLVYKYVDGKYTLLRTDPNAPADANTYTPWFADASLADFDNDGLVEVISRPYIAVPDDLKPT
jgi:hypothetical protein